MTHAYAYDVTGRQTADAITVLGTGVDGAVRRIESAYDALGRVMGVTSFIAPTAGTATEHRTGTGIILTPTACPAGCPSGRVQDMIDPRGITARTLYDALGRTTASIANYTGAAPGAQTDVTTLFKEKLQGETEKGQA